MQKLQLVDVIQERLEENNFSICRYHGCFDIAAKKEKLLFLKILQNVDSLARESSENLKLLSQNLDASALVVGEHTNVERLKTGVVYERFDLPTISFETFFEMIFENIFPRFYRDRGGMYVEIDSENLRAARNRKNLSQRELAGIVGVSKKAIYQHETSQLRMVLQIAEKIEKAVDRKITKSANPLEKEFSDGKSSPSTNLEKSVGSDLRKIGFSVNYVRSAPFDIFARAGALVISDIEENKLRLQRRAPALRELISVVKKPAVAIIEKFSAEDFEIPVVERKELKELKAKDLIRIAKRAR
ncbi:MAG TPA: hypothetical protein VI933_04665 [archaeon]|nr:hypothetical protein [archaeon]